MFFTIWPSIDASGVEKPTFSNAAPSGVLPARILPSESVVTSVNSGFSIAVIEDSASMSRESISAPMVARVVFILAIALMDSC